MSNFVVHEMAAVQLRHHSPPTTFSSVWNQNRLPFPPRFFSTIFPKTKSIFLGIDHKKSSKVIDQKTLIKEEKNEKKNTKFDPNQIAKKDGKPSPQITFASPLPVSSDSSYQQLLQAEDSLQADIEAISTVSPPSVKSTSLPSPTPSPVIPSPLPFNQQPATKTVPVIASKVISPPSPPTVKLPAQLPHLSDSEPVPSPSLLTAISPPTPSQNPLSSVEIFTPQPSSSSKSPVLQPELNPFRKALTTSISLALILAVGFFGFHELITNAKSTRADETILTASNSGTNNSTNLSLLSPRVIHFQGQLSNQQHYPLQGFQPLQFSLYHSSDSQPSQALWNSNYCQVEIDSQGSFQVNLGAGLGQGQDLADCGSNQLTQILHQYSQHDLWLEVTIAQETLSPRQALTLSPINTNDDAQAIFYYQPGYDSDYQPLNNLELSAAPSESTQLTHFQQLQNQLHIPYESLSSGLHLKQSLISSLSMKTPQLSNLSITSSIYNPRALKGLDEPAAPQVNAKNITDTNLLGLSSGKYQYAVSFVTFDGHEYRETKPGQPATVTVSNNGQVELKNLPTFPKENVIARRIYRTKANENDFFLVKTIADNFSATYSDSLPDSQLHQSAPNHNNTNAYQYQITYFNDQEETNPSLAATFIPSQAQAEAILNGLPVDDSSSARGRRVYRTLAGGSTYYLIGQINNNQSTLFTDSVGDHSLTLRARPPQTLVTDSSTVSFISYPVLFDPTTPKQSAGSAFTSQLDSTCLATQEGQVYYHNELQTFVTCRTDSTNRKSFTWQPLLFNPSSP